MTSTVSHATTTANKIIRFNIRRLAYTAAVTAAFSGAFFSSSLSAQNVTPIDDVGTANKALVLAFIDDVFNEGNVQNASLYAAPEYIQNTPGTPSGLDALQGTVIALHSAFPDIRYDVHQLGAEGNLVAARLVISGTQEGEFFGVPATGNTITASAINFWRVTDGLIREHWEVADQLTMLRQLELVPNMPAPNVLDEVTPPITRVRSTEDNEAREERQAVVSRLFDEVLNAHNLDAAADVIAPDFAWHNPDAYPGIEGFQGFYTGIFNAFPDVQRTTTLTVTDGNHVFVLNEIAGTHQGDLYGIPATGNPIRYASADIFQVQDGLITDQWDVGDYVTLFTQLGVLGAQ